MHNHFLKSKISEINIGEQRKGNKCRTESVKIIYCSLYCCKIHSWKTGKIYINIYTGKFKYIFFFFLNTVMRQHNITDETNKKGY